MDKETLKALLAHARYSFSEIEWDFDKLTLREKCLIKNQETLDKIKTASILEERLGASL